MENWFSEIIVGGGVYIVAMGDALYGNFWYKKDCGYQRTNA